MSRPVRVPLSRRKGWRMPENTVKVDRSTRFGNPYQAGADGEGDRAYLVSLFREHLARPEQAALVADIRATLRGKNLACWCPSDGPCHADVLLQVANEPDTPPGLTTLQERLFRHLSDGEWHSVATLLNAAMGRRFAAASLVPTHIGRLRKKLPAHQRIENAALRGYRLVTVERADG